MPRRCSPGFAVLLLRLRLGGVGLLALLLAGAAGCDRGGAVAARSAGGGRSAPSPVRYVAEPVGRPVEGRPWIAHVNVVDLDRDGLLDLLVCDAQANEVTLIRQSSAGQFAEQALAAVAAPVHAEPFDLNGDGRLDVLVASMGQVFPNNQKIGAVLVLENRGDGSYERRVLLEETSRVTDVRAADLNGDGRTDLAVAQFGYDQGEVAWLENRGDGGFRRHVLLDLSGAVNVVVADFTGDQIPDLATNLSQQWEEVRLLVNDGRGHFTSRVIHGSTNEDFGGSGLALADLDGNGRPDLLCTNGDGFDYADPGGRPWHGVQWLENAGSGIFRYHRIGDMRGAFSPVAVDLNDDGALDVVACSGFNDWSQPGVPSLMAYLNDGRQQFTAQVLADAPTHLMTVAAGRLDGPERPPVLVTGGFHAYPPHDRMSRVLLWRRQP